MMIQALIVLIAMLAAGLVLVPVGWRGNRLNRHPVCALCGFDLEGVYPATITCPECGAGLRRRRGVRIGSRRRMYSLVVFGSACILIPILTIGVIATGAAAGLRLADYKPVGLLLWEGRHAQAELAAEAGAELLDRLNTSGLSKNQTATVVEAALDIQGDPRRPWSEAWGDIIENAAAAGTLSKEQEQRFREQAAVLAFEARPTVRQSDGLPISISLKESRVGSASMFWVTGMVASVEIDGKQAMTNMPIGAGDANPWTPYSMHVVDFTVTGSLRTWGRAMTVGDQQSVSLIKLPAQTGVGRHTATVKLTCQIQSMEELQSRAGLSPFGQTGENSIERSSAALPFVVAPEDTPMVEVLPATAEETERLEQTITVSQAMTQPSGPGGARLSLVLSVGQSARDMAFDVIARSGDREWPIAAVAAEPMAAQFDTADAFSTAMIYGSSEQLYVTGRVDGLNESTVDIVLRPSPAAAARTVGLTRIYGGEVVLRGVSVARNDQFQSPSFFGSMIRGLLGR